MGLYLTQKHEEVILQLFDKYSDGNGLINGSLIPECLQNLLGTPISESKMNILKAISDENFNFDQYRATIIEHLSDRKVADWGNLNASLGGYVGFDTMTQQYSSQIRRRGFQLNLAVVGPSGVGKSTFINTLLKSEVARTARHTTSADIPFVSEDDVGFQVADNGDDLSVSSGPSQTTSIHSISHVFDENNSKVKLTITDTPGFADQVNNSDCWKPIVDYIYQQYENYLTEENSVHRKRHIADFRVHCLLYFIPPTGHCLKAVDIEALKRLGHICNVIPLIAMADTMTEQEIAEFKQRIREDLHRHKIYTYPFIVKSEHTEEEQHIIRQTKSQMPYTVVGSDTFEDGQLLRKLPAGVVEIENPKHCDFVLLRNMLIREHMLSLIDNTHGVFYEAYRIDKMEKSQQL